eukprot:jgi/Orpsp1_1/1187489/evm.model.d7180000058099.1
MKKLSLLAILCFLFYFSEAASISKNGAVRRCYKKVNKSVPSNNNPNNGGGNTKLSCKSLITEIANTADIDQETEPSSDSNNNNDNNENSDDDNNTVKIKYSDNLTIPKGTVLNNNEACVTAIYNINKLLKQQTNNNFIYEQSCDKEFDLNGYTQGLTDLKINIYNYIEEAINKCGDSKIWNGAKLHQACRVLSKTGQTVCHTLVDETYEKYGSKCLKDATFNDMWEFSKWLWERLSTVNNGCYLKQLYDYKCSPSKDVIVTMGSNSYSLRLMCESAKNRCDWPGDYEGENTVIQCLSNSIKKNENKALEILKKNGYACEGSTQLPNRNVINDPNDSSDEEGLIGGGTSINNDNINTNSGNEPVNVNTGINTDGDKKNMVSSGSEPWTNTNQIIGTIFIALFALLF